MSTIYQKLELKVSVKILRMFVEAIVINEPDHELEGDESNLQLLNIRFSFLVFGKIHLHHHVLLTHQD